MSFAAPYLPPVVRVPPYNPPIFGTPPISPTPLPPFVGGMGEMGPPDIDPGKPPKDDAPCVSNGPYCFGLDTAICGNLPATATLFPGIDVPVCTICGAILNTICGITVAMILLVILGIAFYGLTT